MITAVIFAASSASAVNVEMKDFINGIIGIEGKTENAGDDINVLILNPNASSEAAEAHQPCTAIRSRREKIITSAIIPKPYLPI